MSLVKSAGGGLLASLLVLASSCQGQAPETSTQTNWLRACVSSDDCGEFSCVCGVCTLSCDTATDCGELESASCVDAAGDGVVAACDGQPADRGMCFPTCDAGCPDGTSCVAGVCRGAQSPTASVTIDPGVEHQSLIGFGASLHYNEELIVGHPDKASLYDAMFLDSGFELIRMRNRFADNEPTGFLPANEIIAEATARIGRAPALFMTSGSPPAALKANGNAYCSNSDPDCTLIRGMDGGFDYAGFAEHWRASLEAYAGAGIVPDFVSIQNNADWIPEAEVANEACRFLPQEGTISVDLPDGSIVDAEFPGYDQALGAVSTAVGTLPDTYVFSGPETASTLMAGAYTESLSDAGSIGYHLYGVDPQDVALDQLETVRALGEVGNRPIIQSEMQAGGLGTAILAHHALTAANSVGYLQLGFVSETLDEESSVLIGTDGTTFVKLPAYHALAHFARSTARGWTRIEATSNYGGLLSSAFISPDRGALTVVLVNTADDAIDVALTLPDSMLALLTGATVVRTVFDGVERSVDLGYLPSTRSVRVPSSAVVTVASPTN